MRAQTHRIVFVFLLLSMFASVTQAQDSLRIRGSNVLGQGMVPALVESWMTRIGYGDLRHLRPSVGTHQIVGTRDGETLVVDIVGNGSGPGFKNLVEGETEIAMMARELTAQEIDDGWQLGRLDSPDQEYVIALQAVSVLVHPKNPIRTLSKQQVAMILAGRIRDWREVGGAPGPIHLQLADRNTGLAQMQSQFFPEDSATARHHRTAPSIVASVLADPQSLGLVDFGTPTRGLPAVAIRIAGRDVPSDRLHVGTEDYPLTRRLYFRTGQMVTALGRGFVDYAVSEDGQRLLARRGYLSLVPAWFPGTTETALPPSYADLVKGANRLSVSFRFGDAFSVFDSRSAQELARLQAFMARPENRQRKLLLVGLTGKQSSPYQAITLSTERADLVAQTLAELGIHPAVVRGLGYARPVTESATAQAKNLRVEVWMR
ncbi:substrate-binding domain-containing protein [Arenimonas oryziterrae]|uniref:OmpA-like domain-containing protein n=1 Tax=Arenimonas oryziterrae DSM 21050 = YC6267 TaxID=1121015 RepID=A0A091AQL4_9GAMM|nr:substrate-binding domain-containing protein [Arenimonas oryziterrae]KFN41314.1 hypothetical protein N789_05405 [Arenimonas oryziterrae DSM 21050 = YC6267]